MRMLHHSPTLPRLRAIGQGKLLKLVCFMIISSRKLQHNNRKKFFTGNIKLQLLSNKESSLRHDDCLKIHTKSHFSGSRTMTAVSDPSLLQPPIPVRKTVSAKLYCAAHARFSRNMSTMNALKFAVLSALLALS